MHWRSFSCPRQGAPTRPKIKRRLENHAAYRQDDATAELVAGYAFTTWLQATARGGYQTFDIYVRLGARPSVVGIEREID